MKLLIMHKTKSIIKQTLEQTMNQFISKNNFLKQTEYSLTFVQI